MGFYKGFWATFWRDVPGWAIFFYAYEAFKNITFEHYLKKFEAPGAEEQSVAFRRREIALRFLCGGLAGVMSWLFCYPFDLIKTRMQTNLEGKSQAEQKMLFVIKDIYRQHGMRFFFQGITACLMRIFIVDSLTLSIFDYLNDILEDKEWT